MKLSFACELAGLRTVMQLLIRSKANSFELNAFPVCFCYVPQPHAEHLHRRHVWFVHHVNQLWVPPPRPNLALLLQEAQQHPTSTMGPGWLAHNRGWLRPMHGAETFNVPFRRLHTIRYMT